MSIYNRRLKITKYPHGFCTIRTMEDFLKQIIKEAGDLALDYFHKGVTFETKSHIADLVTVADLETSKFLVSAIHEKYPDHTVRSEELKEPINGGAQYEWVIDPIDGTRNFANGIPMWCIIIALVYNGETELGAVYNPVADELFFAKKNHGATLNGMPIKVSEKKDFDFATAQFSRISKMVGPYGEKIEEFKRFGERINSDTNIWVHNFGCILGMCFVASGGIDIFVNNAGLDHDYLAAVLIAREAGAVVTDSEGNEWLRGRQDIVGANPKLHSKVMELFK